MPGGLLLPYLLILQRGIYGSSICNIPPCKIKSSLHLRVFRLVKSGLNCWIRGPISRSNCRIHIGTCSKAVIPSST